MKNYVFNGCDVTELAKEYGTPLYVMSEDEIMGRINDLKDSFDLKYANTQSYYASKAFLTKDMIRIIMKSGMGIDVVSAGELYAVLSLGFPVDKIMFHGNSKTLAEIEMGVSKDVGRFVCDSIEEITVINKTAEKMGKKAKILIRVTPGVDSHTHKYIATANIDSKFGVPLVKIEEAVTVTSELKNVELMGFHFHVGSQLLDNFSHIMAVEILLKLMKGLKDKIGFETQEFDLGGGFGIYYKEGDQRRKASYFIDPMVQMIEVFCKENNMLRPKLMIEPGRWIVGEAGITLYTVGTTKEIPGLKTYVGIDGGLPDNPRPALYEAVYEAVVANKYGEKTTEIVTIAGKCCESGDILIHDLAVPKLEFGDILAVKSTGAYNYSMSSNYNKLPIPPVIMVKDGKHRVSVERQSFEQMYSRDI